MSNEDNNNNQEIPWGQKLCERPFLLLIVGIIIMFIFYTIWGLVEIYTLPVATLP